MFRFAEQPCNCQADGLNSCPSPSIITTTIYLGLMCCQIETKKSIGQAPGAVSRRPNTSLADVFRLSDLPIDEWTRCNSRP